MKYLGMILLFIILMLIGIIIHVARKEKIVELSEEEEDIIDIDKIE